MLAVEKPVVMFSDVTPPHRLLSQKNCLRLTSKVVGWRGVISWFSRRIQMRQICDIFYACSGEESRMDRRVKMHRALHQDYEPTSRKLETKIG